MEDNNLKISFFSWIMVALLVVGNLIGAGILALPINTGLSGFIPSLINMLVFGGAMFFSAIVLAKEATQTRAETFNYPSLYHKYLGLTGKWIAVAANLLLLYGLMVAYITGGSTVIASLFNIPAAFHKWVALAFFALLVSIITTGVKVVVKFNAVFTTLMFVSFFLIVSMGAVHIKTQNLLHKDWQFLPCTIPIIVTSFHFHNIIPTICRSLKWNASVVIKTILLGMSIGFIMYSVWVLVGIGALPVQDGQASLIYAFENNLPATIPLSKMISTPVFLLFSMIFSLVALTAACIANGTGLLAFIEDLMVNSFKSSNRTFNIAIAFLPPLIVSLIYPDLFLKAINIAGGFGIVVLFGILPSVIAISKTSGWRRAIAIIMLVMFLGAFLFETLQETGMLKIQPEVESYIPNIK